ncbi:MAG: DUF4255 domain-containing protein [Saprospiraceae bacterium]
MIHEVIPIIADELNDFLNSRFGTAEEPVIISSILNQDGSMAILDDNKVIVSLINIERDGTNQLARSGGDLPVNINLYVLFASYFNNYGEALKFLSGVIGFFQANPNFMIEGNMIRVELYNPDFKEIGNLWSAIGAKYLPSVVYKFRTISIDEGNISDDIPAVASHLINERDDLGLDTMGLDIGTNDKT